MQSLIGIHPIIERENVQSKALQNDKEMAKQKEEKVVVQTLAPKSPMEQSFDNIIMEELQRVCEELQQQELQEKQRQARLV